jgi:hypothetical protein
VCGAKQPSQISGRGERCFFPEGHRDDVVEFLAEITLKIPLAGKTIDHRAFQRQNLDG